MKRLGRKRRKIKLLPPSGKFSGFCHTFVTKELGEFDGITKFTELTELGERGWTGLTGFGWQADFRQEKHEGHEVAN